MSNKRTIKELFKKAFDNPMLPLLFFSEMVKVSVEGGITMLTFKFALFTIISSIVWVLSDAIDVDVDYKSIIG